MATYDLNRLWLTVASADPIDAFRQTDPNRITQGLSIKSDFSAPISFRTNARADIPETR